MPVNLEVVRGDEVQSVEIRPGDTLRFIAPNHARLVHLAPGASVLATALSCYVEYQVPAADPAPAAVEPVELAAEG